MTNFTHLDALYLGLSHEKTRLAAAKTDNERELRQVWVAGIEKQIADEYKFLGLGLPEECDLTDDELLAELLA